MKSMKFMKGSATASHDEEYPQKPSRTEARRHRGLSKARPKPNLFVREFKRLMSLVLTPFLPLFNPFMSFMVDSLGLAVTLIYEFALLRASVPL